MGDNGHHENGRHKQDMYKPTQNQWLMHQPSMKQLMSIVAERDAAIQERNMALNEKNKALEERDIAIMQRDNAIRERNDAIMERDSTLAALQYQQDAMNSNNTSCPPGCQISRGIKHVHHPHQHLEHQHHICGEASYDPREVTVTDVVSLPDFATENVKTQNLKLAEEPKSVSPKKKPSKTSKKAKREVDDAANSQHESEVFQEMNGGDGYKQLNIGLNQVVFDESAMPAPVCSCTGVYRQCYKWGNGGWQSACCTTTISMYPLPTVPNKKHARVGGRKMSGSAFSKLLSRLLDEGLDLSVPIDLKDHWAKHGTNRYVTIR